MGLKTSGSSWGPPSRFEGTSHRGPASKQLALGRSRRWLGAESPSRDAISQTLGAVVGEKYERRPI